MVRMELVEAGWDPLPRADMSRRPEPQANGALQAEAAGVAAEEEDRSPAAAVAAEEVPAVWAVFQDMAEVEAEGRSVS